MNFKHRKVLIVEDEPDISELLEAAFAAKGAKVRCAQDGSHANWILSTESFSAIITDLIMPKMGGIDLIKKIKADKRHDQVPIVVISGALDDAGINKLKSLAKVQVIAKPFKTQEVINAVARSWNMLPAAEPKKNIDASHFQNITQVVTEILSQYLAKPPSVRKPFVSVDPPHWGHATVSVAFHHPEVQGLIHVSFDQKFIVKLMQKIFPEVDASQTNDAYHQSAMQICQQIGGETKVRLLTLDNQFKIEEPTTKIGDNHKIESQKPQVIIVPIDDMDSDANGILVMELTATST